MPATAIRKANLRQTLSERRREMQNELQGRIRNRRTDRPDEVGDDLEHSDADIQGDIEFAVLQMRAETLEPHPRGARPARRGQVRVLFRVRRPDF